MSLDESLNSKGAMKVNQQIIDSYDIFNNFIFMIIKTKGNLILYFFLNQRKYNF